MEERMGDPMRMLPNTRWEAAHLTKACARKLVYLETFVAFQLGKKDKTTLMSAIQLAKHQEENRGGLLIAETTKRASPSIQKLSLVKEAAMQEVRMAAKASLAKASEEDNL
jgi:hypothetical protein